METLEALRWMYGISVFYLDKYLTFYFFLTMVTLLIGGIENKIE